MSYKGYKIKEFVLHDYRYPEMDIELIAPCGCQACEDEVQPGHAYCSTSPEVLREDENVYPVYDSSAGWYWRWVGPDNLVDYWESQE